LESVENGKYLMYKSGPGISESYIFMYGSCSMQVITRPYSELPDYIAALNDVKVSNVGNDWIIKYGSTLYEANIKTSSPNYFMLFMTFTTKH
jgi:hypothetical protein